MSCIFIISGDAKTLYRFFILHQPSQLRFHPRNSDKKWKRNTLTAIKFFVLCFLIFTSSPGLFYKSPPLPSEGTYTVEKFIINNRELPHSQNDSIGWKKLLISYPGWTDIILNNDSVKTFEAMINTKEKTLVLRKPDCDNIHANLHYILQEDYTFFYRKDWLRLSKNKNKKKEKERLSIKQTWIPLDQ